MNLVVTPIECLMCYLTTIIRCDYYPISKEWMACTEAQTNGVVVSYVLVSNMSISHGVRIL